MQPDPLPLAPAPPNGANATVTLHSCTHKSVHPDHLRTFPTPVPPPPDIMAAPPLLPLEELDLTNTVASQADVQGLLAQRGTFAMLDGVLFEDAEAKQIVGFKDLAEDDWWAADHIPGRPLFPGALMVECAAQLSSYDFMKNRGGVSDGKFVGFGGMNKVRFRGIVSPPARMLICAVLKRARSSMFVYETEGWVDGSRVFEAEIIGVVV
ncbi:MAG: 3-hydroxyacyl-[acyl-carrier-protein] dehydratase [Planctomycetota bacterium]|jgi:3-hydroxyacyl-[acyl-carrier-protein] dehydratase